MREEFRELNINPIINIGLTVGLPNEEDPSKWLITLLGPKDTYYKGGLFYLEINIPSDYPNNAPKIFFITPIYHPNVNNIKSEYEILGNISIDVLYNWKPLNTIREVILKVYSLFYRANPESPYSKDIADEFKYNRTLYEKKVAFFTRKYANPMAGYSRYKSSDKSWDFSINEDGLKSIKLNKKKGFNDFADYDGNKEINLNFSVNGAPNILIQCKLGERVQDVLERFKLKYSIPLSNNIIIINNSRQIDLYETIGKNELLNRSPYLLIITDDLLGKKN